MNFSKRQAEAYFFGNPKSIGAKILFIKREGRLEEYKQHLNNTHEFGNVWHGITGSFNGEMVSIIATGIGPSMVGDAVYALNRPDTICLYSGTCGGLHEGLEIGDYFIADQAVCGDGYTFHLGYPPMTLASGDPKLLMSLKILLASKVDRFASGMTFTTSSVVREIDTDFWQFVSNECCVIEMGASAFYASALATHKRPAAYFWVTDLPTRGKSFFQTLASVDIQIKQRTYDRSVTLDLELLSAM